MKFYEISMIILSKSVVHVWKKWKMMIFDRKSEKSTFISIDKKPSKLTSKFLSESRRLFTSSSWKKWKMKPMQLFHTCTTFLHQNFVTFRKSKRNWKLLTFSKQKRKRFVTKVRQKWKMTPFCSIWPCVFSIEMKTTFLRPQARNLAQTNGFGDISLRTIFDAQRD